MEQFQIFFRKRVRIPKKIQNSGDDEFQKMKTLGMEKYLENCLRRAVFIFLISLNILYTNETRPSRRDNLIFDGCEFPNVKKGGGGWSSKISENFGSGIPLLQFKIPPKLGWKE